MTTMTFKLSLAALALLAAAGAQASCYTVLNAKGEFVGVIFDGNIQMLPGNFYYDGAVNRGVTLDVRAILEALRKVYDASFLADELTGK